MIRDYILKHVCVKRFLRLILNFAGNDQVKQGRKELRPNI